MKICYELEQNDIVEIIAEKFQCDKMDIVLRKENEPSGAGHIERIKATVRKNK